MFGGSSLIIMIGPGQTQVMPDRVFITPLRATAQNLMLSRDLANCCADSSMHTSNMTSAIEWNLGCLAIHQKA